MAWGVTIVFVNKNVWSSLRPTLHIFLAASSFTFCALDNSKICNSWQFSTEEYKNKWLKTNTIQICVISYIHSWGRMQPTGKSFVAHKKLSDTLLKLPTDTYGKE